MPAIYLDNNASTPIAKEVAEAMLPFLTTHFGNPGSKHVFGEATKKAVDTARRQVADLLAASPGEIVFTSGGTESNNMAILGAVLGQKRRHVIYSAVEHPAVAEVCKYLGRQGFRLSVLPVDEFGRVQPDDLHRLINEDTALVSVMHANNEVGSLQPIAELAAIAKEKGAVFHCDAAQSIGKIPVNVQDLGVDLLSVAGHKFYAAKGVGALFIRDGLRLEKITHGANHEKNRRPGTENVLEIVGLGKAAELAQSRLESGAAYLQKMRDALHEKLLEKLGRDNIKLNGHPELRLPNTLNLSFRAVEANRLLSRLRDDVAASAGAACHADDIQVSEVLSAMAVPMEFAMGSVRLSTGMGNTMEEMELAAERIAEHVRALANWA